MCPVVSMVLLFFELKRSLDQSDPVLFLRYFLGCLDPIFIFCSISKKLDFIDELSLLKIKFSANTCGGSWINTGISKCEILCISGTNGSISCNGLCGKSSAGTCQGKNSDSNCRRGKWLAFEY